MKKLLFILLFFLSNYFYAQVNFSSGVSKFKTEDYKGAIDEFTKVIDANPKNILAYFNRALAKSRLHDYKGAMEDYDKVYELDPSNVRAYKLRELERKYLARSGGTAQDFSSPGTSNPYEAAIYGDIGFTKEKEGHHLEAIKNFNHAIELNNTNASYYLGRGNAMYHLKAYQSAKEDYANY